jgi:drug/metabolite transporter (DMT)-like permease
MSFTWLGISLLGAFIFGCYSFLLGLVHPAIKNNDNTQFAYGLIIDSFRGLVSIIFLFFWKYNQPKNSKILEYNLNWNIILLTIIFGVVSTPVHGLVMVKGGSIGHQIMFSLGIIPILFGSWFYFGKKLDYRQWIGLFLSVISTFLMTYHEKISY